MKNVILAIGLVLLANGAQAQYESLVETKMAHLHQLENSVQTTVGLSKVDKAWALEQISASKNTLTRASELDLTALQTAEVQINETSKKVAGRLLMTKKAKLLSRIATVEAMILQYQTEGLDTEPLETLLEAMKLHLSELGF